MKNRLPAFCFIILSGLLAANSVQAQTAWDNVANPIYTIDKRVGLGTDVPQERLHLTRIPTGLFDEPTMRWSPNTYSLRYFKLGITTPNTPAGYLTDLPIGANNGQPDEGGDMIFSLGQPGLWTGQDLLLTNRTMGGTIQFATRDIKRMTIRMFSWK